MQNPWSLLFITDLHYEDPDANFVDDNKDFLPPGYRDNLFSDYDRILNQGFQPRSLDLIAIGGDITTHGKDHGFSRFLESLPLLQHLVKVEQAICIVPGNHDVKWGLEPTAANSFNQKFAGFLAMVEKTGASSCLYPEGELKEDTDNKLVLRKPPNDRGPIYVDRDRKLLVMCINSAVRCGELNGRMQKEVAVPAREALRELEAATASSITEKPAGLLREVDTKISKYLLRDVAHVTQAQRNMLLDQLTEWRNNIANDWSSYLRIALLHHHVIHFPGQITEHKGYELLEDSADVLSMLAAFDFDLILTGHKHQPYIERHFSREKEILIVGGPTIGGYAAGSSFRGLRLIEVADRDEIRSFRITDLPNDVGKGSVRSEVEVRARKTERIDIPRGTGAAWEQRKKREGFFYRELSAITLLDEDGDARRIIECEDFNIQKEDSPRARQHTIQLPATSGYVAQLRAKGKGFDVRIDKPIPREKREHSWDAILDFSQDIGKNSSASYSYQWYAVNSFALDRLQFDYMYPEHSVRLRNIEFTHFTTQDPVQEFTLVVRFPHKFELKQPPQLRIARVDRGKSDTREWEVDTATQLELTTTHALHYYESLNIAALRVNHPRPDLSYGIQWEVPPPPSANEEEARIIRELRNRWQNPLDRNQREELLDVMALIIDVARETVLGKWKGPVDASFMYFDGLNKLPMLVALRDERRGTRFEKNELVYHAQLRYGDGIAGRAFKINKIRAYGQSVVQKEDEEPDYYTYLEGGPKHQVMMSLPIHMPETTSNFKKKNDIYEKKRPYAVFNLGSERSDCPLAPPLEEEKLQSALRFQHEINVHMYERIKALFLDN